MTAPKWLATRTAIHFSSLPSFSFFFFPLCPLPPFAVRSLNATKGRSCRLLVLPVTSCRISFSFYLDVAVSSPIPASGAEQEGGGLDFFSPAVLFDFVSFFFLLGEEASSSQQFSRPIVTSIDRGQPRAVT